MARRHGLHESTVWKRSSNSTEGRALQFLPLIREEAAHPKIGDGPHTVSESTVSNTELSEFLKLGGRFGYF